MARAFLLGGRLFTLPEHTTARQDAYVVGHAMEAGITRFTNRTLDEDTALQLCAAVLRSGKLEHLLAGMLVEDGVKWTAAYADANAEMFGELTDPEEKSQMQTGIVETIARFFLIAPVSSMPSPNASTDAPTSAPMPPSPEHRSIVHEAPVLAGNGAA